MGQVVAQISQYGYRPSEILEIEGSALEKILWDAEILANVQIADLRSMSVADKIRMKRRFQRR